MKSQSLFILALILVLCSCAAMGTKTIYKSSKTREVRKIGYCTLARIDTLSLIYDQTATVFDSAMNECAQGYLLRAPEKIALESNNTDNRQPIIDICKKYGLDGILFTNLTFVHVTYSVYYVPVTSNYDTEVMMQLFDNQGELLCTTKHNTFKGNSYLLLPSAERTVYDGIKGAFKRMAKEMEWELPK